VFQGVLLEGRPRGGSVVIEAGDLFRVLLQRMRVDREGDLRVGVTEPVGKLGERGTIRDLMGGEAMAQPVEGCRRVDLRPLEGFGPAASSEVARVEHRSRLRGEHPGFTFQTTKPLF